MLRTRLGALRRNNPYITVSITLSVLIAMLMPLHMPIAAAFEPEQVGTTYVQEREIGVQSLPNGIQSVGPYEFDIDADVFQGSRFEVPIDNGGEELTLNLKTDNDLKLAAPTGAWTIAPNPKAGFDRTIILGPGEASIGFYTSTPPPFIFDTPISTGALVAPLSVPSLSVSPSSVALDACEPFPSVTVSPEDFSSGTVAYSLSPAPENLPAGLVFDPDSGVISGSATGISADTQYTITANGPNDESATATINIEVERALSPCNQVITVSKEQEVSSAFTPLTAAGFDDTITYSAPDLPGELEIDSATGVISGEFDVLTSNEWVVTITASDGQDTAEATVTIRLVGLSPQGGGTLVGSVGQSMVSAALTPKYFTDPPVFSITSGGSLPAGLSLDTTNGQISGTPTEVFDARDFTITATNPNDAGEVANVGIRISVPGFSPSSLSMTATDGEPVSHPVTVAWEKIPGTVSFYIDPPLPAGLTLVKVGSSTTQAEISGTPSTGAVVSTHTITAFNGKGSLDGSSDPDGRERIDDSITVNITTAPTAKITFEPQGGSVSPAFLTAPLNTSIQLPAPLRSDYAFRGWFDQSTGGARVGGASESVQVTADDTLYAQWIEVATPPEPEVLDDTKAVTPGDSISLENGLPVDDTVVANDDSTGLTVTGADFELKLDGVDGSGSPVKLADDGVLVLSEDRRVDTSGRGFTPNAPVGFYLFPRQQQISSVVRMIIRPTNGDGVILLGKLIADGAGDFSGTLTLPPGLSRGDYMVQAVGVAKSGVARSITLGVRVEVTEVVEPVPTTPPGKPVNVAVTPSDASVIVTWSPPEDTGSFPVTTYQVVGSPSGTCLVSAPAQTCVITGLTNGVEYTFRVRALTGAGWGSYSEPTSAVIPEVGGSASIMVTGTRAEVRGRPGVQVTGVTTGLEGALVTPRVRLAKEEVYSDGVGIRTVGQDGKFTWQRISKRWIYVYFVADGVRSNRLVFR